MTNAFFRWALCIPVVAGCCASWAASADLTGQELASRTTRSFSGTYWGDMERGWFWYEDPLVEPEVKQPRKPAEAQPRSKMPGKAPEVVELERLQKELEDARKIAIMRPTERNVLRYMRLEAEAIRKASQFADVAQRLGWTHAELDMTLDGRPVNPLAIQAYNQKTLADADVTLRALSQDHAIFFFFRGDCPYCHAYAPILEQFASKFGFTVVPVSLDGGKLPQFPQARDDNGIAQSLGVTQVPATFLAQPYSGTITPLGFGVLSTDQLVDRITVISSPATKRDLPGLAKQLPGQ